MPGDLARPKGFVPFLQCPQGPLVHKDPPFPPLCHPGATLVTIPDPPRHTSTSLARSTGPQFFFFCGFPRGGQEGTHTTPAGGVNSAGAEHPLAPGAVPGLPAEPTRGVGGEQAP